MRRAIISVMEPEHSKPIVFFDGYCGLCDRLMSFLLEKDKKSHLLFAPLQGTTAQARGIQAPPSATPKSMFLLEEGKFWEGSTAVLRSMAHLPFPWHSIALLLWVPAPIRDFVYGIVARNRYRWFGKRETCRLPSPQEKARFLP